MTLLSRYGKQRRNAGFGSLGATGFSIIELLVVVAILATISAVAVPSFLSWSSNLKYRDTAIGLSSKLKLARDISVTKNLETRVELQVANKRFRVAEGNSSSGSTVWTVTAPWVSLDQEVSWHTGTACGGTADINITFNPNGSSGGGVVCVENSALAEQFRVVVSTVSGRVRID